MSGGPNFDTGNRARECVCGGLRTASGCICHDCTLCGARYWGFHSCMAPQIPVAKKETMEMNTPTCGDSNCKMSIHQVRAPCGCGYDVRGLQLVIQHNAHGARCSNSPDPSNRREWVDTIPNCHKCNSRIVLGATGRVICSACGLGDQLADGGAAGGAWYAGHDQVGFSKLPPALPKPPEGRSSRRRAVLSAALDAAQAYDLKSAEAIRAKDFISPEVREMIKQPFGELGQNQIDRGMFGGTTAKQLEGLKSVPIPSLPVHPRCAVCNAEISSWSNAGRLSAPGYGELPVPLCAIDYPRALEAVRALRKRPEGQTDPKGHPRESTIGDWDLLPDA
jgi:hypothetical protein